MKLFDIVVLASAFGQHLLCSAKSNRSTTLSSHQILPANFKPPQVFKNVNLLRSINLEKGYVKEVTNLVIENTDKKPQSEYFLPFRADEIGNVGGLEVKDKKEPEKPAFSCETVEYDPYSATQFYRITLPQALAPSAQQTLHLSYHVLSSLKPVPARIPQQGQQHLLFEFSTYFSSAYPTDKQKTKIKFPTSSIPDFTGDPERQGSTFTYGPYDNVPAGAEQEASVRYEFTKPVIHATLIERDVEVSQWGGNLATEERYWLTNQGAELEDHFSRVQWAVTAHYSPATAALRELKIPLKVGSLDPYYTDDIGNVSTSHFRSNSREATLEMKPRYPVFGGWKYSFRLGWDANLHSFLRKLKVGDGYVLRVPFLEGPKPQEGISYEKVELRIILPEGAKNVRFESPIQLVSNESSLHRTFMDTVGRTTLELTAMNVVDEARDKEIIVTYDYPFLASFRKPMTIFTGILLVFLGAWGVGQLDISIKELK